MPPDARGLRRSCHGYLVRHALCRLRGCSSRQPSTSLKPLRSFAPFHPLLRRWVSFRALTSAAFGPPAALFCCARLRSLWAPPEASQACFHLKACACFRGGVVPRPTFLPALRADFYYACRSHMGRPPAHRASSQSRPPTQSSTRSGSQNIKNLLESFNTSKFQLH